MGSLQRRLDVGLLVSLIIIFFCQWFIVSGFMRALTEGHAASRLKQDSEVLLAALHLPKHGAEITLNPERIDPIYKRPFSGRYFQIKMGQNMLRSRSLWDQELAFSPPDVGQSSETHVLGPQGQQLLLKVSAYQKQKQHIVIAVAEDLSAMEAGIKRFQKRYALFSLAILVVLMFIQRKIVQSGLRPLEKGRHEMTSLKSGEIKQLSEAVPDEIKPFVKEINRLLEGMTQRLQRSRNATGNLAHALKVPITLLVQLSDRDELKPFPALRSALTEQLKHLHDLLDRELKRARLAGAVQGGQVLRLESEIAPLFDALRKIYHGKNLEMACDIPKGLNIAIDREDFLELAGNLLDNACKWAEHRVSFKIEETPGFIQMRVEDDGPGVPPEALTGLADRGARLDESSKGHGLGLAIARDIVTQYAGEITFGKSTHLGGFQVTIKLKTRP